MKIKDKVVLITGANRGIGRALVAEALQRGARQVYAGMRAPVEHPDKRVVALALDVTDLNLIGAGVASVPELDVLINNAGVALYDDLSDSAMLDKHLDVNLYGPYRVTQAFLPLLRRSRGAIVNNLSIVALAPFMPIASYSISKAAAFSMTQSLRAYLASDGVSVHAVMTGPVDTDMNRGLDIPKTAPDVAARNIFDGLENGQEEIFPDPMSATMAESWNGGGFKAMERQNALSVKKHYLTIVFQVDKSPLDVFNAVLDPRSWWSEDIVYTGDVFDYHFEDVHRSKIRVIEAVPGERVVWHVLENYFKPGLFGEAASKQEWAGTRVIFDITAQGGKTQLRFVHEGLVPECDCYDVCSNAWGHYIGTSLYGLIDNGKGQPNKSGRPATADEAKFVAR